MKVFSQLTVFSSKMKSVARYISPAFPYGQIYGVREDGALFVRNDWFDPESRRKKTDGWTLVTNRAILDEFENLPSLIFKGSGHPMTKSPNNKLRLPQQETPYRIPNWT